MKTKSILLSATILIIYTISVYKATVYYNYDIKDHIIYGQVIPYEYMNNGDLARVKLHADVDNFIDSVTLTNVTPTFDIDHPEMGSMHIDIASIKLILRDRGEWIQFKDYDELNSYIASKFSNE